MMFYKFKWNVWSFIVWQEGTTPLSHLSQGTSTEKLRELLNRYLEDLEDQNWRKAIEACSETKAKMEELEVALSNIVGLHELVLQLQKWAKGMLFDERRRAHMAWKSLLEGLLIWPSLAIQEQVIRHCVCVIFISQHFNNEGYTTCAYVTRTFKFMKKLSPLKLV